MVTLADEQMSAKDVWLSTPYVEDLHILQKIGVQPGKLGGMRQILSIYFDMLFRKRLDSDKFWAIKAKFDDTRMRLKSDEVSLITIADERYYGDFCGIATKTSYSETGYSEKVLDIHCFYTDDDSFDDSKIPSACRLREFERILRGDGVEYKQDKIYCIMSYTEESIKQYKGRFWEYVFYIPSRHITRYD